MSKYTPLSATDLIDLANNRKVAMVDLNKAGLPGIVFVTDLTAAQQQTLAGKMKNSRVRQNTKEDWIEYNWGDLADADAAKVLEMCLVTDDSGGKKLAELFEEAEAASDEPVEFITVPSSELIMAFDQMAGAMGKASAARERLNSLSNAATSLIAKKVREISGLAKDEVDEKKGGSALIRCCFWPTGW